MDALDDVDPPELLDATTFALPMVAVFASGWNVFQRVGLIAFSWINLGVTYYILDAVKDGDPSIGEQDTLDF